jgi:hypothetical protein
MRTPDVTRIRISSVGDCLGIIPPMLGFEPTESLVVMVAVDGTVELTARVDLAVMDDPGAADSLLGRIWGRFPGATATFVAYTADPDRGWAALAACDAWLPPHLLRLVVLVSGGRWWADTPEGPGEVMDAGRVAAEAVYRGMVTRSSREELAASIAGPPEAEVDRLLDLVHAEREALRDVPLDDWPGVLAGLVRGYDPARGLDDAALIRLALLCRDGETRDTAVLGLTRENAERQVALWTQVVRRTPEPLAVFALGVLGMASWVRGDGALQCICLEQIEEVLPDCGIARMLSDIIESVVPPSTWEGLRARLLASSSRRVRRAVRLHARRQGSRPPTSVPTA